MSIKLVAVDLDDTLLDNSVAISPRTREVIRQAIEKGVMVTVATGRMYSSALPYAQQLELDVPLITYNGGLIRRSLTGETLLYHPIDQSVAVEVLALFRSRGWYIQTYLDDVLYVDKINEKAVYYATQSGIQPVPIGDQLYDLQSSPIKMLAMATPEEIAQIHAVLLEQFSDRLDQAISKPTYLEMMAPDVNKGTALAFLAGMHHIKRDEVMAIGDSDNDLDMIQYAGWGVAMGNASDKVKAAARLVTLCNDEDGVAEAILKYVL